MRARVVAALSIRIKPRFQFRTALLETFESRQLMASDTMTLTLPSYLVPTEQPDVASLVSSEDSKDFEEAAVEIDARKQSIESGATSLLPKGYSLKGQTAQGALAGYIQGNSTADLSTGAATDAAWSDFNTRSEKFVGLSSNGISLLKSLSKDTSPLRSQMIGSGLADRETSRTQMAGSIVGGDVDVLSAVIPGDGHAKGLVMRVGWFCKVDGTSGSNTPLTAEGEGPDDGDDPISIPQVDFPQLELSGNQNSMDTYVPSSGVSGQTVTTQGAFNASTTADSDMTLPGVNSVHMVTTNWIDADHWSVTETLIMSFNITVTAPVPSGDGGDGSNGGDGSTDEPSHLSSSTSSSSLSVSRMGFIVLVFHAEKGMSLAPAAGVLWSIDLNFSDKAMISLSGQGGTTVTPNPNFTQSTDGGNTNSGGNEGDGYDMGDGSGGDSGDQGEPALPQDFNGTSSWNSSITLSIFVSGTIHLSLTPALVVGAGGTEVEKTITYNDDINVGVGLILGGGWTASSSSGNINGANPNPGSANLLGALASEGVSVGGQGGTGNLDVPSNGQLGFSSGEAMAGWEADAAGWEPMDRPQGNGHAFGSSGGFQTNVGSGSNDGMNFTATVRGEQLTSLAGGLKAGFKNKFGDQLQDNQILVFQDGRADDTSMWSGMLMIGTKVSPQVAANVGTNKDYGFTVDADGVATVSPSSGKDSADASGSDNGMDFEITTVETASLIPTLFGGSRFRHAKSVDKKANGGSSSGNISAEAEVNAPETGKLKLKWDGSGIDYSETQISNFVQQPLDSAMFINDPSFVFGFRNSKWKFNLKSTTTYSSDGDTETNVTGSGDAVNSGAANSQVQVETDYTSHSEQHDEQLFSNQGYDTYTVIKSIRDAAYTHTATVSGSYSNGVLTESGPIESGDTKVGVTGFFHYDYWYTTPDGQWDYHDFDRLNLADGTGNYCGDGSGLFCGPYDPTGWDGRNGFEKYLDGSGGYSTDGLQEATGITEVPPVIQQSTSSPQTWLAWFAGQKGDAGDQAINFAAGFSDNITMGAGWYWRDKVWGVDTVDYDSSAYVWGDRTATAIQVVGGIPAAAKAGVAGAKAVVRAANTFDDAGRCGNVLTKLIHGGCFVAGTLVTVAELPRTSAVESEVWGGEFNSIFELQPISESVATVHRLLVPIEEVPIGARIATRNPRQSEVDLTLPEPAEESWGKISFIVYRDDGSIVDAEIIRPTWWIHVKELSVGDSLSIILDELQLSGVATVTAIENCPMIATGPGSVVTGRFVTRDVNVIAFAEIINQEGDIEVIEGTLSHPFWSVDRCGWVKLGDLQEGERLLGESSIVQLHRLAVVCLPSSVYNIEVHSEHVYQIGEFGVLVHNVCDPELLARWGAGSFDNATESALKHFQKHGVEVGAKDVNDYMRKAIAAMDSRKGRGVLVEGATEGVRRFNVHGTNRYVDVDTLLEKVISFGARS